MKKHTAPKSKYNPKQQVVKYPLSEYGTVNNKFHWKKSLDSDKSHFVIGQAYNIFGNSADLAACGALIYCVESMGTLMKDRCKKCRAWEHKNFIAAFNKDK